VGLALVVVGLAAAAFAQLLSGAAPLPLYDGVSVTEPYRYLAAGPDQPADPFSADMTVAVDSSQSPTLLVATEEVPPQAQLIASDGALALPPGATALTATITPVAPSADQAKNPLTGNIYRIAVVDQSGKPVTVAASKKVTVALRKPQAGTVMTLERWDGQSWTHVPGNEAAGNEIVGAPTDQLGDFVLFAAPGGVPLWAIVAIVVSLGGVLAALALTVRTRRRRADAERVVPLPIEAAADAPRPRKRRPSR
jgi:hypothetical protein